MSTSKRLWILFGIIVLSAVYAVLIKKNSSIAGTLAIVYVVLLFILLAIAHLYRKRDHHG